MAKVLVVDDEPINREFLIALLALRQHKTLAAADGAEGLALVRAQRPDLVITDILMPVMDGYEFVRRVRSDPVIAATTVIFYSAEYRGREARELAESCGVKYLLAKPSDPKLILRAIDGALGVTGGASAAPREGEFERDHLRLLTDKLSEKATELRAANERLSELVEANLRLAAENDTYRMLEAVCAAGCNLIGAKYAVVGVDSEHESGVFDYFVTSGLDPGVADSLGTAALRAGTRMAEQRPYRMSRRQNDPRSLEILDRNPAIASFLAVPITSPTHTYGWLCLNDKVGREEFSEEDERLTALLAAHVGRLYENHHLYAEIRGHTLQLEREVADRRKAEQQLRELNEQLDRRIAERTAELELANHELEAFSYSVSHDLRAPLRAVTGFASILAREFSTQLPGDAAHMLERVTSNAARMEQLIEDLLRFSRLGKQAMTKQPIDTNALVEDVLEAMREERALRGVEVRLGDLPGCIGDPSLLRQVFVNLLSNAFKFTRRKPQPLIEIDHRAEPGERVYFVRDNGAGFDMRYATRLFGVFQRLHRADEFEGTGVGLSLVQRIVRRHGGRVWAEAQVDAGATFYFALPE